MLVVERKSLKVITTSQADSEIFQIAETIKDHSADSALKFLESVDETISLLSTSPNIGTSLKSDRYPTARYRPIVNFPIYLIFYQSDEQTLTVTRVVHGNRDLKGIQRHS